MKWRFQGLLLSLVLLAFGGVILALALGWTLPINQLLQSLQQVEGRWIVGLIGSVFIFLALVIFSVNLKSQPVSEGVIQELKLGRVVTTVQALEAVVHKAVRQVRGVREVKPFILVDPNGLLSVTLKIVLAPDTRVPDVALEIQENVKNQVYETVGTEVLEVKIQVDNVGYDLTARVD